MAALASFFSDVFASEKGVAAGPNCVAKLTACVRLPKFTLISCLQVSVLAEFAAKP